MKISFAPLKKEVFSQIYGLSITDLNLDFTKDEVYKVVAISDQTVNVFAEETSKENLEEIIANLEETDLLLLSTSVVDGIYGTFNIYSIIIAES